MFLIDTDVLIWVLRGIKKYEAFEQSAEQKYVSELNNSLEYIKDLIGRKSSCIHKKRDWVQYILLIITAMIARGTGIIQRLVYLELIPYSH